MLNSYELRYYLLSELTSYLENRGIVSQEEFHALLDDCVSEDSDLICIDIDCLEKLQDFEDKELLKQILNVIHQEIYILID